MPPTKCRLPVHKTCTWLTSLKHPGKGSDTALVPDAKVLSLPWLTQFRVSKIVLKISVGCFSQSPFLTFPMSTSPDSTPESVSWLSSSRGHFTGMSMKLEELAQLDCEGELEALSACASSFSHVLRLVIHRMVMDRDVTIRLSWSVKEKQLHSFITQLSMWNFTGGQSIW